MGSANRRLKTWVNDRAPLNASAESDARERLGGTSKAIRDFRVPPIAATYRIAALRVGSRADPQQCNNEVRGTHVGGPWEPAVPHHLIDGPLGEPELLAHLADGQVLAQRSPREDCRNLPFRRDRVLHPGHLGQGLPGPGSRLQEGAPRYSAITLL